MPLQILKATRSKSVQHQELYEDEVAFWIGFLGLFSRSQSGKKYIQSRLRGQAYARTARVCEGRHIATGQLEGSLAGLVPHKDNS